MASGAVYSGEMATSEITQNPGSVSNDVTDAHTQPDGAPEENADMISSGPIEQEMVGLLEGRAKPCENPDIILNDPSSGKARRERYTKPILGDTTCYVVAAVVFNEKGQVLLTREGFHPCYGKWYLPAGRVDPLETLEEAAVREVREETGLQLEATSLLVVENPSSDWFRFTFTGRITGGKLRTMRESDSETLEAGWWDVQTVKEAKRMGRGSNGDPLKSFQLRGGDIVRLIELVKRHNDWARSVPPPPVHLVLPTITSLQKMLLRPVLLQQQDHQYCVLCCGEADNVHVPVIDIGVTQYNTKSALVAFLELVGVPTDVVTVHGVLAVEHDGRGRHEDGLCLSVLASVAGPPTQAPPAPRDPRFRWRPLVRSHTTALCDARRASGATISLLGL